MDEIFFFFKLRENKFVNKISNLDCEDEREREREGEEKKEGDDCKYMLGVNVSSFSSMLLLDEYSLPFIQRSICKICPESKVDFAMFQKTSEQ